MFLDNKRNVSISYHLNLKILKVSFDGCTQQSQLTSRVVIYKGVCSNVKKKN